LFNNIFLANIFRRGPKKLEQVSGLSESNNRRTEFVLDSSTCHPKFFVFCSQELGLGQLGEVSMIPASFWPHKNQIPV
jgi:hypothetical protein